MPKVVFFDYWLGGLSRVILPIADRLKNHGIDCTCVYLGSWSDPGVPAEQVVQGLLCRDIRFYGGSLQRAIECENPRLVITFNTRTVDRLL